MSTYIVTGGAGFIGSHLAEALLGQGHTVRVIDNFATGKRENLPPGADFYELDFTDLEAIRPVFQNVDGVFHVGAMPRIPLSIEKPLETSQANIMGTLSVLQAARDAGVKRVVNSASSSAYGTQPTTVLHPGMPINPLNPYALQKYVGEKFTEYFSTFYGLPAVSLRYFNVYGPRMDNVAYPTFLATFIALKKAGQPLTITGDGEQTRAFTHVSDVVRANILAMESPNVGKGEVLNVGNVDRHSVNEVVKVFGGPTTFIPPRPGEMRSTQADISLTKELLGWEPQVPFSQGLRELLALHGIEPAN